MTSELAELITKGILRHGDVAHAYGSDALATVTPDGLLLGGQLYADPTAAMQAVTGETAPGGNGWVFWRVLDPTRQFLMPLEHARHMTRVDEAPPGLKTSLTHPLRIDHLTPPGSAGRIGMTICPGKSGASLFGGTWARDLGTDLEVIKAWAPQAVVTVMEAFEFDLLGVPHFAQQMADQPFRWFHLEVEDSGVPDHRFEAAWPGVKKQLLQMLKDGGSILVHCRGGLGRTGMVVASLLVEMGMSPEQAIQLTRQHRPGAIETSGQESYVKALRSGRAE